MIEIPLTQNKVALIDDEDYELVSQYKWYAVRKNLGRFKTQEEAVLAYNDAAAIYHGEFALAGNMPKGNAP